MLSLICRNLVAEPVELLLGLEDYSVGGMVGVCRRALWLSCRPLRWLFASSRMRWISVSLSPLEASIRIDCSLAGCFVLCSYVGEYRWHLLPKVTSI